LNFIWQVKLGSRQAPGRWVFYEKLSADLPMTFNQLKLNEPNMMKIIVLAVTKSWIYHTY